MRPIMTYQQDNEDQQAKLQVLPPHCTLQRTALFLFARRTSESNSKQGGSYLEFESVLIKHFGLIDKKLNFLSALKNAI